MSRAVSATGLRSLFAEESSEVWVVLLTLDHVDLPVAIRVCSDAVDIVSRGETFVSFPFELTLPDDTDGGPPRATLTIDNVSREIAEAVRSVTSPPSVVIEVVRAAEPNVVEAVLPVFELRNVRYNAQTVSGELEVEDLTSEPYPADSFTPAKFRGLF
jgi:hypothetical protein